MRSRRERPPRAKESARPDDLCASGRPAQAAVDRNSAFAALPQTCEAGGTYCSAPRKIYRYSSDPVKSLRVLVPIVASAALTNPCWAETSWGGSLTLTSDYLVRGVSRSDGHAALQLDLHLSTDSGWVAGVFASNSQIDPHESQDAELDAFVGYRWDGGGDWKGRMRATYYSYPWNQAGSAYNYVELDADVIYRDLLQLAVIYSPDEPHHVPYRGLIGASSTSIETNFQHAIYKTLSAIAGVGYSYLGGPSAGGYEYWSVGTSYELGHAAITVSYVDTSGGAKSLFYNDNVASRWAGSVIYRF